MDARVQNNDDSQPLKGNVHSGVDSSHIHSKADFLDPVAALPLSTQPSHLSAEDEASEFVERAGLKVKSKIGFEPLDEDFDLEESFATEESEISAAGPDDIFADSEEGFKLNKSFFGSVKDVLTSAGIGAKQCATCFVALIVIAGSAFLFFTHGFQGVSTFFKNILSFGDGETIEDAADDPGAFQDKPIYTLSELGLSTLFSVGGYGSELGGKLFHPSLEVLFTFGDPLSEKILFFSEALDGLNVLHIFGSTGQSMSRFGAYIANLAQIKNALQVDVGGFLDTHIEREKALDQLLTQLNELLIRSKELAELSTKENASAKESFQTLTEQKTLAEESFFRAVHGLSSEDAAEQLQKFIGARQKQVEAQAFMNALAKVISIYKVALQDLNARINDIEKNREALVKDVQVIDIQGSKIDLIVPVESDL